MFFVYELGALTDKQAVSIHAIPVTASPAQSLHVPHYAFFSLFNSDHKNTQNIVTRRRTNCKQIHCMQVVKSKLAWDSNHVIIKKLQTV